MVNLPETVLKEVFDFLGIRERWRVRSTCKKWKFVVDTRCHPRSVCIYSTSYPYNERWCFSDQRVVEDEMIYLKFHLKANRLFDLRMEFFRNLQKVYLYHLMEKMDLFLEEASQLTRLEVLMIEESSFPSRTLSSLSLKKLSLKVYDLGGFQLNTPNLSSLILWNSHFQHSDPPVLEFGFPLKVKHLECIEFTRNLGIQLKNLETLVCVEIPFDFRLNEFKFLTRTELWSFAAFRTVANEKRRLNRMNLQVLASGFDWETVAGESLEIQEKFFCRTTMTFEKGKLALNSSFLEKADRNQWNLAGSIPCSFDLFNLEPESLISFASRIPRVFFDKFRIDRIYYSLNSLNSSLNQIDQSALVELAEKCCPSTYSVARYRLMSRGEIEQLSRIQSIKRFHGSCDIESAYCLLNLKNLEDLQIYSPKISIDFICKLFEELKFFYALYFQSPESTGLHLHINFYNYRQEGREADGIAAETLYSINYHYGPVSLTSDTGIKKDVDFKDLDELIKGVKGLREDNIVKSFFV